MDHGDLAGDIQLMIRSEGGIPPTATGDDATADERIKRQGYGASRNSQ